jgi:hypothetical protein
VLARIHTKVRLDASAGSHIVNSEDGALAMHPLEATMLFIPTIKPPLTKLFLAIALLLGLFAAFEGVATAAQDRFTLKALSGISFSEIRGYEDWPAVSITQTEEGNKLIVANPTMIEAFKSGTPGNGKSFPDGSKTVKMTWLMKSNAAAPFASLMPDTLLTVELAEKDSARFLESDGWGYAQFMYDPMTDTFTEKGALPARAVNGTCHACHTIAKARDFIFMPYSKR